MRTVLITGSDTAIGKTRVVAGLARTLADAGERVQIVKVVETGRAEGVGVEGDAACARRLAAVDVPAFTLVSFAAPLAPVVAARAEGAVLSFDELCDRIGALPPCDWRLLEGAGGIATPIDVQGRDWADFARAIGADSVVVVVPDRLGAINQARLAYARATQSGVCAGIWLNAAAPADAAVAASNREGLAAAGLPVWAEQRHGATVPENAAELLQRLRTLVVAPTDAPEGEMGGQLEPFPAWCGRVLRERERRGLRRTLRVTNAADHVLNLADNDYLALARDPAVTAAVAAAGLEHGASASASPLITGWREPHERLIGELCGWHGFAGGLLWNSGYTANSAVLGLLPRRGDLVLADRLIHHSMIDGLLRSGARLQRYPHLDLGRLEEMLAGVPPGRTVFVATETVFSMDGDCSDLERFAQLKRRHRFHLIVDEAHALGWYGPAGAGLARAARVEDAVDVLVGTLGKTLGSGGAYTLFRDGAVRVYVANHAGEFVYSTALPPTNAAAASAALARVRSLAAEQPEWHARSRDFRARLRAAGWNASDGDSPIVPVQLGSSETAVALADRLREEGILAAAIRPPTVPAGTSRLRFSLKRTFGEADAARVLGAMERWRELQ